MQRHLTGRKAEERLFRSFWQDGSLDLFGGLTAAAIGLCWLSDVAWAGAILPALIVPLWGPWRRSVIEPRLGRVRFLPARQLALRRGTMALFLLGCFGLLLGGGAFFGFDALREDGLLWLLPGIPALLLGLATLLGGLVLGLSRFVFYALVFAAAAVAVAALELRPGVALSAGGAVTLMGGTILFVRFLREHPAGGTELR